MGTVQILLQHITVVIKINNRPTEHPEVICMFIAAVQDKPCEGRYSVRPFLGVVCHLGSPGVPMPWAAVERGSVCLNCRALWRVSLEMIKTCASPLFPL